MNPEYKIVDGSTYLPFDDRGEGAGGNGSGNGNNKDKDTRTLTVIKNPDGSNGVSLYENDLLILKTVHSDNVVHSFDEDARTLISKVLYDQVAPGKGIKITRGQGEDYYKATIEVDEEFVRRLTGASGLSMLRGENGVIVDDDWDEPGKSGGGKVVYLDDEYTIEQGEY